MTVPDIIEEYEIPQEFHEALWKAYEEGAKRGFIDASIADFNTAQRGESLTPSNQQVGKEEVR